jgi:hypothetical protein
MTEPVPTPVGAITTVRRRRWPFALLFLSGALGYAAPLLTLHKSQRALELTQTHAKVLADASEKVDVMTEGIDDALDLVTLGMGLTIALWVTGATSVVLIVWDIWRSRKRTG